MNAASAPSTTAIADFARQLGMHERTRIAQILRAYRCG